MLVTVESRLSSPFSGYASVEAQPEEKVQDVIKNFLLKLHEDGSTWFNLVVYDKDHNILDLTASLASQGISDGAALSIGYNRKLEVRPPYLVVIGIISFIIAAILIIAASVLFSATGGSVPFDYGIVIDAGSTHTEVFLYRWHGNKDHGTGYVSQEDYCNIDQGIAATPDPSIIVPCVSQVVKSMPNTAVSHSPLFLGATAGMRILNISDPKDANLILLTLKFALQLTQVNVSSVNTIEGQVEGIFSWITTNFLSKTLHPQRKQHFWNSTFGALDLGGASTQFAYALDPSVGNRSDVSKLKLYGENYFVTSKSFLCYGVTQAFTRNEVLLIKDFSNVTIYDPCLPEQYSLKVNSQTLLSNPCVQNPFLKGLLERRQHAVKEFTFVGGSDYEACKADIRQLMNNTACIESGFHECAETVYLAEADKKFMAFSSFYYITNFLESTNVTFEQFINSTEDWCKLNWDEMQHHGHNKSDLSRLPKYCFGAIYIAEFLTSIYGFNSSTWENIIFQKQINNTDIGWSLGYMINATNAIPEELPSPPMINGAVFSILVVVSFVIFTIAIYLLYKNFKLCFKKENYQSLIEP